jgi:Arc/MetJ-type ribon-helix-helix transcriptional regulator
MKMDTMNISLPRPMAEFVRQAVERDYGNVSEYFRELVRQRMKKKIEADLRLLRATGPAKPSPPEKDLELIERIKHEVRKDLRARGSGRLP